MKKFFQQTKAMLTGALKGITTFYKLSLFTLTVLEKKPPFAFLASNYKVKVSPYNLIVLDKKQAFALLASSVLYGATIGIGLSFLTPLPPVASLLAIFAIFAIFASMPTIANVAIASLIRAVQNIFGNKGVYDTPLDQAVIVLDIKQAFKLLASSVLYGATIGIGLSFLPPLPPVASLLAIFAIFASIPIANGAIASLIRAVRNIFGNKGVYDTPLEQAVEAGMKATNASLAADKLPRMYNLEHATTLRLTTHSVYSVETTGYYHFYFSNNKSRATFDETKPQELSKSEKALRLCNGGK